MTRQVADLRMAMRRQARHRDGADLHAGQIGHDELGDAGELEDHPGARVQLPPGQVQCETIDQAARLTAGAAPHAIDHGHPVVVSSG
jgi:hypothetical protein